MRNECTLLICLPAEAICSSVIVSNVVSFILLEVENIMNIVPRSLEMLGEFVIYSESHNLKNGFLPIGSISKLL